MRHIRARVLRKLIAPVNWHKDGYCRFPVLCLYDDLLIAEIDGIFRPGYRARWRTARADRREIDEVIADFARRRKMPVEDYPPLRPQPKPPVNVPPPPIPRPAPPKPGK